VLQAFFADRLITQRRASSHTIASYRDTFRLLLGYAATHTGKTPSALDIADLDAPLIAAFLDHLEHQRHNTVRTRNTRLAAIHSLFGYAALHHPEHAAVIQRVLAIPIKRYERRLLTWLTEPEVDALLAAPNRGTWAGRRDHAMLVLAVQTGLRISELIGLSRSDVNLGAGAHVHCLGKGRKERATPLTPLTVAVLRAWLIEHAGSPTDPLFPTRTGARLSHDALNDAGIPQFEGSNAWAVSGSHTRSGKPLLAGDPHISFAVPAVWYEAELSAPGFNLYGYFQALNPFALLGHNRDFGWSLTMFQNDDVDLIAERTNPANSDQVMIDGTWQTLEKTEQTIAVKGEAPVTISLRRSPHGPIVNEVLGASAGTTPVAMWWAFLETENPILDGFYQLNRADTLGKMREAAAKVQAPGLNFVWANARGDIGWWAAAQLPIRPQGVNPTFILDGASPQADKLGFHIRRRGA
jgi:integrase